MGITFNSLVMSNSHQSTAVVLKDFGMAISRASTVCAVEEDASDRPRLRGSAVV